MKKIAVVLFNLGGPDTKEAVQPFLYNLFSDKAIIQLPGLLRLFVARMISKKRAPIAQDIYAQMGGGSPILPLTQQQAKALEEVLAKTGDEYKTFICMRYWHPMAPEVIKQVKAYAPDEVILLPLYPQFSTTTTASSFSQWSNLAKKEGLSAPARKICCYPTQDDFISAHVSLIQNHVDFTTNPRLIFSAHGLPEKIIKQGDPYQWQVEKTVEAIVEKLGVEGLDHVVSYQSRVGPLKWIGPSTEEELKRAGSERKNVVVIPVAFVSEHSETLVELDIEYKHLAQEAGVSSYVRVPALGVQKEYIAALARLCVDGQKQNPIACHTGGRICPAQFSQCPNKGTC